MELGFVKSDLSIVEIENMDPGNQLNLAQTMLHERQELIQPAKYSLKLSLKKPLFRVSWSPRPKPSKLLINFNLKLTNMIPTLKADKLKPLKGITYGITMGFYSGVKIIGNSAGIRPMPRNIFDPGI